MSETKWFRNKATGLVWEAEGALAERLLSLPDEYESLAGPPGPVVSQEDNAPLADPQAVKQQRRPRKR